MNFFKRRRELKWVIIAVVFILFYFLFFKLNIFKEIINIILISFIIAYALKPTVSILEKEGFNRRLASILLVLLLGIIIVSSIIFLMPVVFKESVNVSSAIEKLYSYFESMNSSVNILKNNKIAFILLDNINIKINNLTLNTFNTVVDCLLNIAGNLLALAIVPILVYYFLADCELIKNKFFMVFPIESRKIVKRIISDMDKVLSKYVLSQIVLCLIVGVLTFIILIFLNIDFPVILSLLNAFFNIIPYFGPFFGAVPIILIALLKSGNSALWVAVWLYLIQQVEGNVLSPKITGDSINMHPLLVIVLLLVGGKVGGFIGMILSVPLGVIIKVIYEDINYYIF